MQSATGNLALLNHFTILIYPFLHDLTAHNRDARLAAQLAEIEVDAAIVPDLPPEEAGEFRAALLAHGLGLVPLLAPSRAEDSADDPSAVIDWLLKNRR